MKVPVLIAGAGPTGLVLALWLTRLGVPLRIIDKTAEPGTTSRALAVQARTLEFYSQPGIADLIVENGRKATAVNFWVRGRQCARAAFGDIGTSITPFPYVLTYPQDEHERLLIDQLAQSGVEVERQTELLSFEDTAAGIVASLRRPDGSTERCEAAWLAGCDGAHSAVREALHVGFPGGVYAHLFYVADVEAQGAAMNGEVHVALDAADFLAVFPLKGQGRARLVGTVRDATDEPQPEVSWNDVSKRVIDWMHIDVGHVNWFSTYRVHHRVAEHFREEHTFLLGDAAHIHSPVGGQGMNTGIGDAVNLSWKLAAVVNGRASASLLDTYERERIGFARRLVATTDRAFTAVTSRAGIVRYIRLNVVPAMIPFFFQFAAIRRFLFRTVSQTAINYRTSPLSAGRAGAVHGGDRLPWIASVDNFRLLTSLDWQVHVYGEASDGIRGLCEFRRLPLHVFPWFAEMDSAGLRPYATYLVRPDGYVAFAEPGSDPSRLSIWLDAHPHIGWNRAPQLSEL